MNNKVEELLARGEAKGYEVGSILLSDTINKLYAQIKGQNYAPFLNKLEVQQLLTLLKTNDDIVVYNRYIDLVDWLEISVSNNVGALYAFLDGVKTILLYVKSVYDMEHYLFQIETQPRIMEKRIFDGIAEDLIPDFLKDRKDIKLTLAMVLQMIVYSKYFKHYINSPRKRTASNALIRQLAKTKAPQELVNYLNKINNSKFTTKYNLKDLFIETIQTGSFFHHDFTKEEKEIVIKNYHELFVLALEEINTELETSYTFKDLETPITNYNEAYKKNLFGIYQDAVREMAINQSSLGNRGAVTYIHKPLINASNIAFELTNSFLDSDFTLSELVTERNITSIMASLHHQLKRAYISLLLFHTVLETLDCNLGLDECINISLVTDNAITQGINSINAFLERVEEDFEKMAKLDQFVYNAKLEIFQHTFKKIDFSSISIPNSTLKKLKQTLNKNLDIFNKDLYDFSNFYDTTLVCMLEEE